MAERGVWVGGGDIFGSSVHCAHLDTGTPPEAPAASVADVETVHKKDARRADARKGGKDK